MIEVKLQSEVLMKKKVHNILRALENVTSLLFLSICLHTCCQARNKTSCQDETCQMKCTFKNPLNFPSDNFGYFFFITAHKRSCGSVMFLHLSVILFIGVGVYLWVQGMSASGSGGVHPKTDTHTPRHTLPWTHTRPDTPLDTCTQLDAHPLDTPPDTPLPLDTPRRGGHSSWNAFLFYIRVYDTTKDSTNRFGLFYLLTMDCVNKCRRAAQFLVFICRSQSKLPFITEIFVLFPLL